MIPKKLFFTYKTDDIPRFYQENLKRWQSYCSDWEMLYYSDQKVFSFFKKHFPEYAEDLQKISHGAVIADLFRYAVLYIHGGMYNDIDTIPLKKIPDEWLRSKSVVGYEYQPSQFDCVLVPSFSSDTLCQWSLLSEPENPLFKEALDQSIERIRKKKHTFKTVIDVLEATGPLLFTQIAQPYLKNPDYLFLDMDVFSPIHLKKVSLDQCVVFHQYHGRSGWKMELQCPHIKII